MCFAPCLTPSFLSEILLTAEEAVAILADVTANDKDSRPQDDVSNDKGGAAAALTALEANARREAEALAVLLSDDGVPGAAAESALTRLAARYLVRETVRGKIPDPVGNFHVRRLGSLSSLLGGCSLFHLSALEAALSVIVRRIGFIPPSQCSHGKASPKRIR